MTVSMHRIDCFYWPGQAKKSEALLVCRVVVVVVRHAFIVMLVLRYLLLASTKANCLFLLLFP